MSTDRRRDWRIRNAAGLYLRGFDKTGEALWTAKESTAWRHNLKAAYWQAEYLPERVTLEHKDEKHS